MPETVTTKIITFTNDEIIDLLGLGFYKVTSAYVSDAGNGYMNIHIEVKEDN